MKRKIRIACIQTNAGDRWQENFKRSLKLIQRAVRKGACLIALPEAFCWRGGGKDLMSVSREATRHIVGELRSLARRSGVAILLGSIFEIEDASGKIYNTSLLIGPSGRIEAKYRKIHLFDSSIPLAKTRESDHVLGGKRIVTALMFGVRCGLSICYDLRFPELYRNLAKKGSRIIFIPANFTHETGKAHWEVLIRARAIENQVFVIAPGQVGRHPGNRILSYGTSLIVDPWGRVLKRGSRNREEI